MDAEAESGKPIQSPTISTGIKSDGPATVDPVDNKFPESTSSKADSSFSELPTQDASLKPVEPEVKL